MKYSSVSDIYKLDTRLVSENQVMISFFMEPYARQEIYRIPLFDL